MYATGPSITPSLWFDHNLQEAAEFYTSVFPNSVIEGLTRYTEAGPGEPGAVVSGARVPPRPPWRCSACASWSSPSWRTRWNPRSDHSVSRFSQPATTPPWSPPELGEAAVREVRCPISAPMPLQVSQLAHLPPAYPVPPTGNVPAPARQPRLSRAGGRGCGSPPAPCGGMPIVAQSRRRLRSMENARRVQPHVVSGELVGRDSNAALHRRDWPGPWPAVLPDTAARTVATADRLGGWRTVGRRVYLSVR